MTGATARVAIAAVACNVIEWLDFIAYGLFAVSIAKAFFPANAEQTSLLLAFASFGSAFVTRPLGAVVLGQISDRHGRRAGLAWVAVLMTAGTALIALTPGYATLGVLAPVLVVLGRLLQGFSVGGDLGNVTALLIEAAPTRRRGWYASWQMAGQFGASALGIAGV
jgi:MHS family proline/betaine transporter-like MFS transporter